MTHLEAKSVSIALSGRQLVENVSLDCRPGDMIGLIGPNGAGKTTLMRALAGLISHDGAIMLDGKPVRRWAVSERSRKLAYLPQDAPLHWPLTVREIVALGRLPHGAGGISNREPDNKAIERALAGVNLTCFSERRCDQLSAGERARVLVARLLAVEADIMLADEPVGALDPAYQLHIMDALARQAESGRAVIAVLHDLPLAAQFCHRLVLLCAGKTVAVGTPAQVLTKKNLATVYGIEPHQAGLRGPAVRPVWRAISKRPAR